MLGVSTKSVERWHKQGLIARKTPEIPGLSPAAAAQRTLYQVVNSDVYERVSQGASRHRDNRSVPGSPRSESPVRVSGGPRSESQGVPGRPRSESQVVPGVSQVVPGRPRSSQDRRQNDRRNVERSEPVVEVYEPYEPAPLTPEDRDRFLWVRDTFVPEYLPYLTLGGVLYVAVKASDLPLLEAVKVVPTAAANGFDGLQTSLGSFFGQSWGREARAKKKAKAKAAVRDLSRGARSLAARLKARRNGVSMPDFQQKTVNAR